jgi:beta-lactam-binding protein with PASTA domain
MKAETKAGRPTPLRDLSKLFVFSFLFICFILACFNGQAMALAKAEMIFQQDIVIVPPYIGMQVEQAVSRMPNDRLSPGEINEVYADAPPGTVIEQFPEPEMRVDPGTFVNLEVSLGPQPERRLEVPNVKGLNVRQAEAVLRESGLQIDGITERASDEREGIVLEQSPQAGAVVMENAGVNLVVSIRNFQVTVPEVLSMSSEKAIRVLKESRLNYELYSENSDQPENTVVDQNPPPGSLVDEGAVVFLFISRQKQFSQWLIFGGIILVGFLGGFIGYHLKKAKTRKNHLSKKKWEITFKPVWETGNQIVNIRGNQLTKSPLHFKYVQDSGSSTILKSEK